MCVYTPHAVKSRCRGDIVLEPGKMEIVGGL